MEMPRFHLARDGRSLGQKTSDEVAAGLVGQLFRPTDLSWKEGEPAWMPLVERPEFRAANTFRQVPEPALERRREMSLPHACVLTLREILLGPVTTFTALPPQGSLWVPFLWHLVLACLANVFGLVWAEWLIRPMWESVWGDMIHLFPWGQIYRYMGYHALLTPVLVTLGVLVTSALIHLGLMLFGGGKRGWGVTFRVMNYVGGAANAVLALPFFGILAFPWGAYCLLAGLSAGHRDASWKTILAILFLFITSCCLLIGGAFLAFLPFTQDIG
jgi:hypothetical protein